LRSGQSSGNLQANSLNIGNKILAALNELKKKYKLIGDVRGKGLLLCIESGIDNRRSPLLKNARK